MKEIAFDLFNRIPRSWPGGGRGLPATIIPSLLYPPLITALRSAASFRRGDVGFAELRFELDALARKSSMSGSIEVRSR
jgi:hypothetical protein